MVGDEHSSGNGFLDTCRFGVDIQRMVYAQLLPAGKNDPVMLLHLWGFNDDTLPLWQRIALRLLLPVLVKFVSQVGPFQDTLRSSACAKRSLGTRRIGAELDSCIVALVQLLGDLAMCTFVHCLCTSHPSTTSAAD